MSKPIWDPITRQFVNPPPPPKTLEDYQKESHAYRERAARQARDAALKALFATPTEPAKPTDQQLYDAHEQGRLAQRDREYSELQRRVNAPPQCGLDPRVNM
jgi:hypothetical protein